MKASDTLPASVLVKHQVKTYGPKFYTEDGHRYRITAKVRYDDQCGNGHNSFSITASIDRSSVGRWVDDMGGCCHDEVVKHFPQLAPFIKWHLTSSDGPMHYVANTVYHAQENGATHAWVYFTLPADPLGIKEAREELLAFVKADDARRAEVHPGYRVQWDEKTVKVRNLDHARSSAVWPDATNEQLMQPAEQLTAALGARLPALMAEFKAAVESLGFTY